MKVVHFTDETHPTFHKSSGLSYGNCLAVMMNHVSLFRSDILFSEVCDWFNKRRPCKKKKKKFNLLSSELYWFEEFISLGSFGSISAAALVVLGTAPRCFGLVGCLSLSVFE